MRAHIPPNSNSRVHTHTYSLMHSPTATTTGIVLTAVEAAAARATMVERDLFFRRYFGGGSDYTANELERQHVIWTAQINQSMIIEISAIVLRTVSVVLFLPHRFIFNFGYGNEEAMGLMAMVVVLNMMLELVGEVLTDCIATSAEMENGVPVDRYFDFLQKPTQVLHMLFHLICAIGIVLWTFARVPSAAFCESPDPCSCLDPDSASSNFEIYRDLCFGGGGDSCNATNANTTSSCATTTNLTAASKRFVTNPAEMDDNLLVQIGFAFVALVTTSVLMFAFITMTKRRRAQRQVMAVAEEKIQFCLWIPL